MSTQTTAPHTASPEQEPSWDPKQLSYLEGLFREGYEIQGPIEARDAHFQEVSELVGDLALSDALREKAWEERQLAETFAQEFIEERASKAATRIERGGYADIAPSFAEQLADESRKTKFTYNNLPAHVDPAGWEEKETTEIEGLRDLDNFLQSFIDATKQSDGSFEFPGEAEQAMSMLERLTFVGEKEYVAAARGLGAVWKAYLDGDPDRKLCVITAISNSKKYPGKQKSDQYLRQRIMDTFSEDDLERYSGRIVDNLDVIQDESPENVRVVLLDDWAISGRQISRVYNELAGDLVYQKFLGSVEVNLLAAPQERLANGLEDPDDADRPPIPVKAYYKSAYAPQARTSKNSHISGIHSTVNFGFGTPINSMVKRLNKLGVEAQLPALASIVSPYKKGKQSKEDKLKQAL